MQNENLKKPSIAVALSGGVDSCICALLLKQKNFNVVGFNLKLINQQNNLIETAVNSIANKLKIKVHFLNFQNQFKELVIKPFVEQYLKGLTPNPCVNCNNSIKFGFLLNEIEKFDCFKLATGHYANVEFCPKRNRWLLKKAADLKKDQSYFLYTLSQKTLSKIVFPLGNLTKQKIKQIAAENNLSSSVLSESQDICFIKTNYADLISEFSSEQMNGNFVDYSGKVLGKHSGFFKYTIGQRKGLNLSLKEPHFVSEINPETNDVVLATKEKLFKRTIIATKINLIAVDSIQNEMKVDVKIRSSQNCFPALISQLDEQTIKIKFISPQRAPTKGQSVVFYEDSIVVGGGIISEILDWIFKLFSKSC